MCLLISSTNARAATAEDEPLVHRIFFAASAGATDAFFSHPMLTGEGVMPSFSFQGGVALSPNLLVSLSFDGISRHVSRQSETGARPWTSMPVSPAHRQAGGRGRRLQAQVTSTAQPLTDRP